MFYKVSKDKISAADALVIINQYFTPHTHTQACHKHARTHTGKHIRTRIYLKHTHTH